MFGLGLLTSAIDNANDEEEEDQKYEMISKQMKSPNKKRKDDFETMKSLKLEKSKSRMNDAGEHVTL